MVKKTFYWFFVFQFMCIATSAQTVNEQNHKIHIKKINQPIKIDGLLDEEAWQKAEATAPFHQQFPFDTTLAVMQTQAKMMFDDTYLYYSFVVNQPRKYVVTSLKRDFPQGGGTDLVLINFDCFKDKQNGFHFAVNPYGVQREALLFNGNEITNDWDNKWLTEVKNYDDKWVVECAIPFNILRYKVNENGSNEWNVNFFRNNLLINERSAWAKMPRGARGNDLAFSGTLIWDDAPPKPKRNITIIPYVIANTTSEYIDKKPTINSANAGFDAKISVTPSMNLDLTVNPDFSQVEVDRQVTNLSRFELLFPERRQFFIENNDLFGSFGSTQINPFFSRRIGITRASNTYIEDKNGDGTIDTSTYSKTEGVSIIAGARLSGKVDKNWRLGFLSMQTRAKEIALTSKYDVNVPQTNYSVFAIQRKLLTRSNIGIIFANKQNFLEKNKNYEGNVPSASGFHRIVGVDFNYASRNGFWSNKFFIHKAITPQKLDKQEAAGILLSHDSPRFSLESNTSYVGENFTAEVGYVPRQNFIRNASSAFINFFPTNPRISKHINSWGLGVDWDYIIRQTDGLNTDWDGTPLILNIRFQNNSTIRFSPYRNDYTYLFSDFDPTNTSGKALKAGSSYNYSSTRLNFQSNTNNMFYYNFQARMGNYFNGKIFSFGGTSNYRIIPYALFSLDINYSKISLPSTYNSAQLWLVSPRAEITFSKSIFFTSFVQYNNQANNININSRLQWRFKPVSDMFIVYTDNYFATDPDSPYNLGALGSKSRALVFKLNYWLNM
jgi:hypothetical protein